MARRRRSRWKRTKPRRTNDMQPRTKHARYGKYSYEEHEVVHRAYCRAQLLNMPLKKTCEDAFLEVFAKELPRALYVYCTSNPSAAEARERYLKEALVDPTLVIVANPAYAARTLTRAIEVALTPRLSRIETARVRRDGEWEDVVVEVQSLEPATAIRGVAELRNWMPYVERTLGLEDARKLLPGGGGRVGEITISDDGSRFPKASSIGDGPDDDLEAFRLPMEDAQAVMAEENDDFSIPVEDLNWLSSEAHAEMMRRWDEGIGVPPHAPSRPTRRILKDGTIEIFEGDESVPKGSLEVPGVIDAELLEIAESEDAATKKKSIEDEED